MILKMSEGLGNTCAIFFLTLLFSLPLGMLFALLRMSKNKVVSSVMRFIISVLRGTPLMLQLLAVTYGPHYLFPDLGVARNKLIPVVIAFAINYAAYFAEIYRGGIESVPVGQTEAGAALIPCPWVNMRPPASWAIPSSRPLCASFCPRWSSALCPASPMRWSPW